MLQLTRISFACLALFTSLTATAAAEPGETVVHDTTTVVEVELDPSTVLCSAADYGAGFLKILIPELAALTLLDHQNTGAGAPCVAAGICMPGQEPVDIIDPAKPSESVEINVKAVRYDEIDTAAQVCNTHLIERVHAKIRGFTFVHERAAVLGTRAVADCVAPPPPAPAPAPAGDHPADDPGSLDTRSDAGGCATGGGAGGAGLLAIVLGAVAMIRRRTLFHAR